MNIQKIAEQFGIDSTLQISKMGTPINSFIESESKDNHIKCICGVNYEQLPSELIQCSKCQSLFHRNCVGIPYELTLDNYLCPLCFYLTSGIDEFERRDYIFKAWSNLITFLRNSICEIQQLSSQLEALEQLKSLSQDQAKEKSNIVLKIQSLMAKNHRILPLFQTVMQKIYSNEPLSS